MKKQYKFLHSYFYDIYGINKSHYNFLLKKIGLMSNVLIPMDSVNKDVIESMKTLIYSNFLTESSLKQIAYHNIKNEIDLHTYKGYRHKDLYPVRGQRTRTNARTAKFHNYFYFIQI